MVTVNVVLDIVADDLFRLRYLLNLPRPFLVNLPLRDPQSYHRCGICSYSSSKRARQTRIDVNSFSVSEPCSTSTCNMHCEIFDLSDPRVHYGVDRGHSMMAIFGASSDLPARRVEQTDSQETDRMRRYMCFYEPVVRRASCQTSY